MRKMNRGSVQKGRKLLFKRGFLFHSFLSFCTLNSSAKLKAGFLKKWDQRMPVLASDFTII